MQRIVAALAVLAASLSPLPAEETLLLLARHAEKVDDSGNPDVTTRGLERAEALADIAVEWDTRAIYSTDLCRTVQTAQPSAKRLGMPIFVHSSGSASAGLDSCTPPVTSTALFLGPTVRSAADLLSWILEQHRGRTVLIVGHSNTIPTMIKSLGAGAIEIDDDEYDRLFMVTFDHERGARMVETSYGEHGIGDESEEPIGGRHLPIVDQAIDYHGGKDYTRSRTRLSISSLSGGFQLDVRRREGLFEYAVEETRGGETRRTIVSNDNVDRYLDGEPQDLDSDGARRARDFVNARVYFPFLPHGLNDPSVFQLDQGNEEWSGRSLRRVKVTFAAGSSTDASDDYAFWFDPDTGRLEQYAYSFESGPGNGGLRFRRLYNYRRVGGILFFDASNIGIDSEGNFSVDLIDPSYVAQYMKPISEVLLSEIEVEALSD